MREGCDRTDLTERIAEFRSDPEKLDQVTKFVDELLENAQRDAERKRKDRDGVVEEERRPLGENGPDGMKRRLGHRARGFMVRVYDILCNCSRTAAAAARTHTESLRASKR